MRLGIKEIEQILPHRHPFLLVDYIEDMEPGVSAVGYKCVTFHEDFFRGHFPNNPVMPGVLIIETLAQAASILILKSPEFENKTAYLGAIHQAKFRKVVRPGDVLKLHIVMEKKKSNMGIVKAAALVDGKKACTAELMFAVYDRDEKI